MNGFRPVGPAALIALLLASAMAAGGGEVREIHSQPSRILRNNDVEVAVTELGGHMAPVRFYRSSSKPVQPYHITPWQDEGLEIEEACLVPLRGDFFCMPFGGNARRYRGEKHPLHGEVAGSRWDYVDTRDRGNVRVLLMQMETKVRPGKVAKALYVVNGQNVVYSRHTIRGFAGKTPIGHHATLRVPARAGGLRIAVSPFRFGQVNPTPSADPSKGEYQALLPGARFTDLKQVPTLWKNNPTADLTAFPARLGFGDLVQLVNKKPSGTDPAWVTATNQDEGYVWFALKDADVLPTLLFWIEMQGRHASPWKGRNRCLGLEDVCAYFPYGLAESAEPNPFSRQGIRTAIELRKDRPTEIRYIQGAARVPSGFGMVRTIRFAPGTATLVSTTGKSVTVRVNHEFLRTGRL